MTLAEWFESLPSSAELWTEEKRWHREYMKSVWDRSPEAEAYRVVCEQNMARCKAELDRRGVTHL